MQKIRWNVIDYCIYVSTGFVLSIVAKETGWCTEGISLLSRQSHKGVATALLGVLNKFWKKM